MKRRLLFILAILSLSLHVIVPPGFMPANVNDGWHLSWCPDGMPDEVMYALFGHAHHHHGSDSKTSFSQCDLSGLYAELDLQYPSSSTDVVALPHVWRVPPVLVSRIDARANYAARAPPLFALI